LHGGGKFAVGSTEVLEKKIAKLNIGVTDIDGILQFFDVVIHGLPLGSFQRALEGDVRREAKRRRAL
jgi:hypothetical protein